MNKSSSAVENLARSWSRTKATLEGIIPAMIFLAFWAVLSAFAFLFIGIETKGRSIEEIDAALTKPVLVKALAE